MKDKIRSCLILGYDNDLITRKELNNYCKYINNLKEPQKEYKKIREIPYTFDLGFIYCNINETAQEEISKTINDIINKINEIIDRMNGE